MKLSESESASEIRSERHPIEKTEKFKQIRELSVGFVFESDFHNYPHEEMFSNAASSQDFDNNPDVVAKVLMVLGNKEKIDTYIEKYSKNWSKNRISKVALSVLRVAIAEIMFDKDVPVKIAINEAVDIAKKYAFDDDAKFVNGVLGAFVRGENIAENGGDPL